MRPPGQGKLRQLNIARPKATAFGRMGVMQTLPQDKESYGSDTSHDRKRQLLGGRGVLSLRSFVGKAIPLFF
ncbi:hypothetical protein ABE67_22235 [Cytobacillus firmus]|nr:hypothetical protein [Cytobacillus firmus]